MSLLKFFEKTWAEKYRPKTLDEVIGQEEIKRALKGYIAQQNFPHLLFYGPPGSGKTSMAVAFAKDLLNDSFEFNFLELNASDDRGIDTIRSLIGNFCRTAPLLGGVKIVLLDECDSMTSDAQMALRRPMERFPKVRFVLTANYISDLLRNKNRYGVIDALQSRCEVFEFNRLEEYEIAERLKQIAESEDVEIEDWELYSIASECNGDLRQAINSLQTLAGKKRYL